jgi:imidazolonepropionase
MVTLDDNDSIYEGKAIIVIDNLIANIGDSLDIVEEFKSSDAKFVDVSERAIIPGLIDAHNHLLWAGDRFNEHKLRMDGMTYSEIAASGGGIMQTVTHTRKASTDQLIAIGVQRMQESLRNGCTFLEAKSGYGLSTSEELRLLEVQNKLNKISDLPSIHSTWMGAHAVTKGKSYQEYTEEILSEQLPEVLDSGLAESADVFCEPGWFSIEQSEDILSESRSGGLNLRMHIDEFSNGGGGELASELKVVTADHAHHTPLDIRLDMMENGVMTGFLPGTPYSNGDDWPDFNEVSAHDIEYTIATDFNPNCHINNLPFIGSLLVQRNNVDPYSALVSVTKNAAKTTPRSDGLAHGKIEVGAVANFNILKSHHWESWCMTPGSSPIHSVCLEGKVIDL